MTNAWKHGKVVLVGGVERTHCFEVPFDRPFDRITSLLFRFYLLWVLLSNQQNAMKGIMDA